jgi:hypothetical protein
MTKGIRSSLGEHVQGGGRVQYSRNNGWQLEIPAGIENSYRLAQLDDYGGLPRQAFPWSPPVRLTLTARISARNLPGTWGFGFWNDPFSTFLVQGGRIRFPTLPNAAWFFFASEPNYLSLRDNLPAKGQMAAVFRSAKRPPFKLLLGSPLFSMIFIPSFARWLRRWLSRYIQQDAVAFDLDPRDWHAYQLEWGFERMVFKIDDRILLETKLTPSAPLGLVIWVDNQYARWLPDGNIGYGTLANQEAAWLQIDGLEISPA